MAVNVVLIRFSFRFECGPYRMILMGERSGPRCFHFKPSSGTSGPPGGRDVTLRVRPGEIFGFGAQRRWEDHHHQIMRPLRPDSGTSRCGATHCGRSSRSSQRRREVALLILDEPIVARSQVNP